MSLLLRHLVFSLVDHRRGGGVAWVRRALAGCLRNRWLWCCGLGVCRLSCRWLCGGWCGCHRFTCHRLSRHRWPRCGVCGCDGCLCRRGFCPRSGGRSIRHACGLRGSPLCIGFSLSFWLIFQRCDDHHHVATIDRGSVLNDAALRDILSKALQETNTRLGARLLAAAEQDHGLDLVALFEKANGALCLGLVVVFIDLEAK